MCVFVCVFDRYADMSSELLYVIGLIFSSLRHIAGKSSNLLLNTTLHDNNNTKLCVKALTAWLVVFPATNAGNIWFDRLVVSTVGCFGLADWLKLLSPPKHHR